jgi:nitric oxide reductase large subunit
LNGQPQPAGYTALLNLPIDLARLFGHQGVPLTPKELYLWMSIIICVAIVIIFDIPFPIYNKIRKN